MTIRAKQERIIEAVRQGLEGDAAVEFLCGSGFPVNTASIARNLRIMGGRQRIQTFIEDGKDNIEILRVLFPDDSEEVFPSRPPEQRELFMEPSRPAEGALDEPLEGSPLYDTTKITLRIPSDLFEAIRIAAKVEHKPQAQLIVEILSAALSRMPDLPGNAQ